MTTCQQGLARMAKTTKKTMDSRQSGGYEMLSEEEWDIFTNNKGLIGAFVRDFEGYGRYKKLDYDEWYDILSNSLAKAIRTDDGIGKLSTLFYFIANNDVLYELRKPRPYIESYDNLVDNDILVDYGTYDNHISMEIEDILGGSESELWQLVHLYLLGYSNRDIAKITGWSKTRVWEKLNKAFHKIRKNYEEDTHGIF